MAELTNEDFGQKWGQNFADNEIQNIDEKMLRAFKDDIKDSAVWKDDAGVPSVSGTATQAVITALAATSFDVEVAVAMPVATARYRLRAFPKVTGGGGTTTPPTQPPAPQGLTVDSQRQASFTPAAGTVASDYEYESTETA